MSQRFATNINKATHLSHKVPQVIRNHHDHSVRIYYGKPNCSLIWLHGLGGSAEAYVPFWKHRSSAVFEGCRVKIIQAPQRWVTINQSRVNSWYDVRSVNRFSEPVDQVFNLQHVQESYEIIDNHINEEVEWWKKEGQQNFPPEKRVFIGGMSQGGVMSLHYSLSSPYKLGGAIALSAYLLLVTKLKNMGELPLLLVHGSKDKTILEDEAKNSYGRLLSQPLVDYQSLAKLQHSVCLQEIGMIKEWINTVNSLHELNL